MKKFHIRENKTIALGYASFGLMWIVLLIVLIASFAMLGGKVQAQEVLSALFRYGSGIIIYLVFMSSVSMVMAVAVWNILSFSKRKQRIVTNVAVLLTAIAGIVLLNAMASCFIRQDPDWLPLWRSRFLYNILPAGLVTIAYGYYAYGVRKILRSSNNGIETDAE